MACRAVQPTREPKEGLRVDMASRRHTRRRGRGGREGTPDYPTSRGTMERGAVRRRMPVRRPGFPHTHTDQGAEEGVHRGRGDAWENGGEIKKGGDGVLQ